MLCPATTYAAYFVFKMSRYYGFEIDTADATVRTVDGECCTNSVWLDNPRRKRRHLPWMGSKTPGNNKSELEEPQERRDGWFEIKLGEFYNDDGDDEVEMSLKEVNCNHSKGGLIVQGIEIRPKIKY